MLSLPKQKLWRVYLLMVACCFAGLLVSVAMIFWGQHIPGHRVLGPATMLLLTAVVVLPYANRKP